MMKNSVLMGNNLNNQRRTRRISFNNSDNSGDMYARLLEVPVPAPESQTTSSIITLGSNNNHAIDRPRFREATDESNNNNTNTNTSDVTPVDDSSSVSPFCFGQEEISQPTPTPTLAPTLAPTPAACYSPPNKSSGSPRRCKKCGHPYAQGQPFAQYHEGVKFDTANSVIVSSEMVCEVPPMERVPFFPLLDCQSILQQQQQQQQQRGRGRGRGRKRSIHSMDMYATSISLPEESSNHHITGKEEHNAPLVGSSEVNGERRTREDTVQPALP